MKDLSGKRIAILVANGFEQSEMTDPKKALEEAGARVDIISPEVDKVKGWKHTDWGNEFTVDVPLEEAVADDYDGLVLPGGVINPDKLRIDTLALDFIKQIYQAHKTIGAICHGPWSLINAQIVAGHKVTSWPSVKVDLINAGAEWVDEKVVIDHNIITSRKPQDIPAFNKAIIEAFAKATESV